MPRTVIGSIYIAGRFGRRAELLELSRDLKARGVVCTSEWLTRDQFDAIDHEGLAHDDIAGYAQADLEHIENADALVLFADLDKGNPSKGGMHVETGYALGLGMPVYLVGPRLNVFHYLPWIEPFAQWSHFLAYLDRVNG